MSRNDEIADVVLIAGPTASGKTSLAIERAKSLGGEIINTDSMQVYNHLRIVTARPTQEEEAQAPHHLFGHVDPAEGYSVAEWLADVAPVLRDVEARGKVPVFVGGTGLYFQALTVGLTPMPKIPHEIREYWRGEAEKGGEYLHYELAKRDTEAAERLEPNDHQRILRALEVVDATGKPMHVWQQQNAKQPLLGERSVEKHLVMPDRPVLHERINRRFEMMVEEGALEEVKAFLALGLDPALPAMKAIGVRELGSHLAGEISLEEAIEKAQAASRQYAKRQMTWFRNQG